MTCLVTTHDLSMAWGVELDVRLVWLAIMVMVTVLAVYGMMRQPH